MSCGNTPQATRPVVIGNCSGFYGDRFVAMTEMLEGGHLDVLTGDYLAELTMLILARQKAKNPLQGYALTAERQLRENLSTIVEKDVKVVLNAGGMNPQGLAKAIRQHASEAGLSLSVASVHGDDLTDRAEEFGWGTPLAANAYLGAFGIAKALAAGAQIIVTGRVTDASLTVGAAAWWHGWGRDNYDAIAGAMAAGHVIECGTQATGGNFSFFTELSEMRCPGFPIAEVDATGGSVITKHADTGGAVTEETVLSQLLYEIQTARYAGPDATLRLDSIQLFQRGLNRVQMTGARGEAPPPTLKVSLTELGGYINELTWCITGLDAKEKAQLAQEQFLATLKERPSEMVWSFAQADYVHAKTQEEATSVLRVTARDPDSARVGRAFSNAAVEMALASYPGMYAGSPPSAGRVYGRFRSEVVAQTVPTHTVAMFGDDGVEVVTQTIEPPSETQELAPTSVDTHHRPPSSSPTLKRHRHEEKVMPLGVVFGARSGDKGGNANIGIWARSAEGNEWLKKHFTVSLLRELIPEIAELAVDRTELDNLGAINFVVHGILGEGVASQARFDPQAKGLAEFLRSRKVSLPLGVLNAPIIRGGVTSDWKDG